MTEQAPPAPPTLAGDTCEALAALRAEVEREHEAIINSIGQLQGLVDQLSEGVVKLDRFVAPLALHAQTLATVNEDLVRLEQRTAILERDIARILSQTSALTTKLKDMAIAQLQLVEALRVKTGGAGGGAAP